MAEHIAHLNTLSYNAFLEQNIVIFDYHFSYLKIFFKHRMTSIQCKHVLVYRHDRKAVFQMYLYTL